ncbi:MAG: hypothetical protein J6C46_09005, partial [Clostridia bacterium]|nr:hypothetical protein [Clostridia bacterium]
IPTLVVKHEDEGGSKLLPNEYIPMVNETTEAESEDLTGWGYDYIEYKPDGKKEDPSEIISEDPRKEKVDVGRVYDDDNEPQDREVIFVYGPNGYTKDDEEFPTGNETKESVVLRSNKRDAEEYNVDIAIPTSEDLYANVITDAFLLDRKITNIEKTETIKVKLVSDNGIPCDYFDVDLEYEYLGVKDVVLKVLDKAIVKNNVLNYNIEIPAKYSEGYKHPKLEYKEGGILAEESFDNKKFLNAVNLGGTWYVDFDIENVNDEAEMKKLKESYQKDPTYLMEYITIPTDKLYVKYNGENIKVMNRVFLPILGDYGVTEKVSYNTKTGTKVVDLSKEIDTFLESKLVNRDVLFANKYQNGSGIYVKTKMENTVDKSNTTYADIYYKDYQKLEGNKITDLDLTGQESKLVKENVQGNDVVVHTPVVNKTKVSSLYSEIKNDNPYDQWVTRNTYEKTNGAVATLVLGKQFTLTIPHKGNHADYSGYGNEKNYNYKGLINNGNEEINNKMNTTHDHFAMGRDVKFSFGVIRCDKSKKIVGEYIAPNTWIRLEELGYALSDESFNFIIPEWEKELWYSGKHTIETRVFAENCPQTIIDNYLGKADLGSNSSKANKNWNKDKVHYIATDTLKVNVIGEIMDLEFRGTNDPGWSQIDTSIGNEDLALGQAGQNVNKGYKTGVKLGYTAYFDITTTGWTGDTTDSIKIIPNYYYVKKGTTTPVKTELYYKPTPSSGYVKLSENPIQLTTIMNQDCYKGRNYVSIFARYIANSGGKFAMDAGRELSNTARILSGGSLVNSSSILKTDGRTTVNYSSAIKTGTSSEIRLPYSTRLVYQRAIEALDEKYGMELPKVAGTDYCIGH